MFHKFSMCLQGCSQGVFFTKTLVNFSMSIAYEFGKSKELHAILGLKLLLKQLPRLPQW